MNAIVRYQGLYGDHQLSYTSDFVHAEPLEDRSKIYSWEIEEHFHSDLIQIFIIEKGNGVLLSEGKKIKVKAPCLFVVPQNILHGFDFESNIIGDVITFSLNFFESMLNEKPIIKKEVSRLNRFLFFKNLESFNDLLYLKNKIQAELISDYPEKSFALKGYFELLFLKLFRENFRSRSIELTSSNRALGYFNTFQSLIRQSSLQESSIKDFATQLGITQVHLNRICHTVVGKSALKVVQDFLLNEAKNYLLNTSYSISEVAYLLNFNDPAYFSRLFKKRVGVSPVEFRKG